MRDQQEKIYVLVVVICTVVYHNLVALNTNDNKYCIVSFSNKETKLAVYKSWLNKVHKLRKTGGGEDSKYLKAPRSMKCFKPGEIKIKY